MAKPMFSRFLIILTLASVICLGLADAAGAAQPRFEGLGDLPGGGVLSIGRDISADGRVVVGMSRSQDQSIGEAFRWTAEDGIQGLGGLNNGSFFSEANGISADGSVIVGTSSSSKSALEAFFWTEKDGMDGIGFLKGFDFSVAYDVAAVNEQVIAIVGFSRLILREAFHWTPDGGMQGLGFTPDYKNSIAQAVTRNGVKAVGFLREHVIGDTEAFNWSSNNDILVPMGSGLAGPESEASDVSADGSVIVGTSEINGVTQAFRTLIGSPTFIPLGTLPGAASSDALGVSFDGRVVVGSSGGRAFMWFADREEEEAGTGMVDVQAELAALGFDLTGWTLEEITAVADDGMTVVGNGSNPDGNPEAFIATLPVGTAAGEERPIAAGKDFTCVIDASRKLVCWGAFPSSPDPDPNATYTQISAGVSHVCGILTSGLLRCFGSYLDAETPLVAPSDVFSQISAGANFNCGRLIDGRLTCFGELPGTPAPTSGTWIDVDAGLEHACAVRSDGALFCFGADSQGNGKQTVPASLGPVQRVAAGDQHTCAIRADQTLGCFGEGTQGEPDDDGQAKPSDGSFSIVTAGSYHTCGIRTPAVMTAIADEIVCFGRGSEGDPDRQATPPALDLLYTAVDSGGMSSQTGHTCARTLSGAFVCFGDNTSGQSMPPGDSDGDGIPSSLDNCPNDANPDQEDIEGDKIGDACDLCSGTDLEMNFDSGMNPLEQDDEDGDGLGDNCDPCLGNPNPACDPSAVRIEPLIGGGGGGAGAGGGGAMTTPPTEFQILIDCGSQAEIIKLGLSIVIPADVQNSSIRFGNDCTDTGCPLADPDNRLSDRIDPDAKDPNDPTQPTTFALLPGVSNDPAANPNALYFSLTAEAGTPLCTQNEQDIFLAQVTIGDLSEGFTPPFGTQGVKETVGSLAESATGEIDDTDVELQSESLETAQVTIEIRPTLVVDPFDPNPPPRFEVLLTSSAEISNVSFALQGEGAIHFMGCQDPEPDPCPFANVPYFDCQDPGTGLGQFYGATVDFTHPDSFVLGQVASGADLSQTPDVQENTIYIQLTAVSNTANGNGRAFNPGATTGVPRTVKLGTVEFQPSQQTSATVPPVLVFAGVETLMDVNRDTCEDDDDFDPFILTDTIIIDEQSVNAFTTSQLIVGQTFDFGLDPDGDRVASDHDACPYTFDDQTDTGGIESLSNVLGLSANGIGDACECGDPTKDGYVRAEDRETIQDILLADTPQGADETLCSGASPPTCGPEDWVKEVRAQLELVSGLDPACPPALP